MVFIKRYVPPSGRLITVELKEVPKEKVPQHVNQAAMAAIITQLSMLTVHAHEMFKSLVRG